MSPARSLFWPKDRDLLREGLAADVVVFDPDAIADRSTYEEGKTLVVGVEHVLVNGEPVPLSGERTRVLPGMGQRRGLTVLLKNAVY